MFACIHAKCSEDSLLQITRFAFQFSPAVEHAAPDAWIMDLRNSNLLFGRGEKAIQLLARAASEHGLNVTIALASCPDAALHAARGFKADTLIPPGLETAVLGPLPLRALLPSLAEVDEHRSAEIVETLESWGIRSFGQLAGMPMEGIFERFGLEGIALQKLAQGCGRSHLKPVVPEEPLVQSTEFEYPVSLREPLLATIKSLTERLCETLKQRSLAAAALRLNMKLENSREHNRSIRLAVPIRDPRMLLKILEVDLEADPPDSAVAAVEISAEGSRPRVLQKNLFEADAPEPEKLQLQVARIAKLVGWENAGSPELLDSHRPRAFRMGSFHFGTQAARSVKRGGGKLPTAEKISLRLFDPPLKAKVLLAANRPVHVSAPSRGSRPGIRGKIVNSGGPWRGSGEWWAGEPWSREEWDVELEGGAACRIYFDRIDESWKVEGTYD